MCKVIVWVYFWMNNLNNQKCTDETPIRLRQTKYMNVTSK